MEPFKILVQWEITGAEPNIAPQSLVARGHTPDHRGFYSEYKGVVQAYTTVISTYEFDRYCPMRLNSNITLEMETFIEELKGTEGWIQYEVVLDNRGRYTSSYTKHNPNNPLKFHTRTQFTK